VGIYNVSLTVMDEYTATSGNIEMEVISIVEQLPSLMVSVESESSMVQSGENSTITVHVTDGGSPIGNATVSLSSDEGGAFSLETGYTEPDGRFTCTFTAPSKIQRTECVIVANVLKAGYLSGQNQTTVIVVKEGDLDLWVFLLDDGWKLVGIVVVILISFVLIVAIKSGKIKMRIVNRCTDTSAILISLLELVGLVKFPLSIKLLIQQLARKRGLNLATLFF